MQINDGYAPNKDWFVTMIKDIVPVWDGCLGQTAAAKDRIDLVDQKQTPIHQSSFHAGPWHRKIENTESNKNLLDVVIEPKNTEWACAILFASMKHRALRFSVD